MDSPLKYDENIVKELGIDAEVEVDAVFKLAYARTQLEEIGKFLWRERVEVILAEAQTKSDVESMAAAARSKVAEHRSNIKGIIASLRVLKKLVHELEATVAE